MPRPRKIQWPIGFEQMLLYVFPNKRLKDRPRFYRLYLRDHIHPRSTIPGTPEEIEATYDADTKRKFEEPDASQIRLWAGMAREKWKREHFKKRAVKMAIGRWSKSAAERAAKKLSKK